MISKLRSKNTALCKKNTRYLQVISQIQPRCRTSVAVIPLRRRPTTRCARLERRSAKLHIFGQVLGIISSPRCFILSLLCYSFSYCIHWWSGLEIYDWLRTKRVHTKQWNLYSYVYFVSDVTRRAWYFCFSSR